MQIPKILEILEYGNYGELQLCTCYMSVNMCSLNTWGSINKPQLNNWLVHAKWEWWNLLVIHVYNIKGFNGLGCCRCQKKCTITTTTSGSCQKLNGTCKCVVCSFHCDLKKVFEYSPPPSISIHELGVSHEHLLGFPTPIELYLLQCTSIPNFVMRFHMEPM